MSKQSLPCFPCVPWFNFPGSCRVDQRIGKALFADNGPLTAADRRIFSKEIEEIVCSYVLDENHGVMLTPSSDAEHDYTCLVQVDVFLKKPGKARRIAELCHRAMPHPLIVVLHYIETTEYTEGHGKEGNNPCSSVSFRGSKIMFSMAEKRYSRDGKEQNVLERVVYTEWHTASQLEDSFVKADYAETRASTFAALHRHYIELLEVLNVSDYTGKEPSSRLKVEERRKILEELHVIDNELASLKARARQESELSRQVELNLKARRLVQHRHELVGQLES